MPKRSPEDIVQVNLRMPEWMRRCLVDEARKADRTLNEEMTARIMQTFYRVEADKELEVAQQQRAVTQRLFKEMQRALGVNDEWPAVVAAPFKRPTQRKKK